MKKTNLAVSIALTLLFIAGLVVGLVMLRRNQELARRAAPATSLSVSPLTQAKNPGDLMTVALQSKDAKKYFGTAVPDLTVITRARGSEWVYDYLNTFYVDEKRGVGVNNVRFPNVGMPHVLWELEGLKKPVYETRKDTHGKEVKQLVDFEIIREGKMTPAEYQSATNDLVNFMTYMAEPVRLERQRLGIFVLLFLAIFFIFAYLLKKEYWKDVH